MELWYYKKYDFRGYSCKGGFVTIESPMGKKICEIDRVKYEGKFSSTRFEIYRDVGECNWIQK